MGEPEMADFLRDVAAYFDINGLKVEFRNCEDAFAVYNRQEVQLNKRKAFRESV